MFLWYPQWWATVKHPRPSHGPPFPWWVSPTQAYYTRPLDKSTWLTQKIKLFTHLEKTQSSNMADSSGTASWRFNQHNFLTTERELWEEPVTSCSPISRWRKQGLLLWARALVCDWHMAETHPSDEWFPRLSCASSEGLLSPCGLSLKDELSKQQRCSL